MGQCPLDLTALWGKETDECHPTRWLHRSVAVISTVCRQKLWVKVKQQRPPGAPLKTQVCVPSGGEAETHRPATKKGSVPHRLRVPARSVASALPMSVHPAAFFSGLGAPAGAQPWACYSPVPITSLCVGCVSVSETGDLFQPASCLCSPRLRKSQGVLRLFQACPSSVCLLSQ